MVHWRVIGYGTIVFPISLVVSLSHAAPWMLLAGFPSGFVAGYYMDQVLHALLYGFVTGCCIALLFLGGVYYLLSTIEPTGVYPGVGFGIVGIFLIAVLFAVESTIAGAIGGFLG